MSKWDKPKKVTDAEVSFSFRDIRGKIPAWESLSSKYWNGTRASERLIGKVFYEGLPNGTEFHPREGVDPGDGTRYIAAIMRSFQPRHEHKFAAASFLLEKWFEKVVVDGVEYVMDEPIEVKDG